MNYVIDSIRYCEECGELGVIINIYSPNRDELPELYEQCCIGCIDNNNRFKEEARYKINYYKELLFSDNSLKMKSARVNKIRDGVEDVKDM